VYEHLKVQDIHFSFLQGFTGKHCRFRIDCNAVLKVPKREIFDRSDFPDFNTIKSLRVGNFRVKINKNLKNI
jgi:hypothetical protein